MDFFKYGYCHLSSCCALWCTPLSMAQTMVRMQLDWLGNFLHGRNNIGGGINHTFKVVAAIYGFYIILTFSLETIAPTPPAGQEEEYGYSPGMHALKTIIDVLFSFYSIFALMKTREAVRNKFNIPANEKCYGLEDFLCSAFCSCCTAAQLSRQVNDFDNYPADFTESGVPDHVPTLI